MTDRLKGAWGSNDMDTLFPDGALTTTSPWPQAGSRKSVKDYDNDKVEDAVRARNLEPVDPRNLHATQSGLTRAGVSHYMGSDEHYKDSEKVGNRDPVVYEREGTQILLGGHHRAAKALLQGKQFDAVIARGGWGPPR